MQTDEMLETHFVFMSREILEGHPGCVILINEPKNDLHGRWINVYFAQSESEARERVGKRMAGPWVFIKETDYGLADYDTTLKTLEQLYWNAIKKDQPQEPKNNDGRTTCFWCQAPTRNWISCYMNIERKVCTECGR